MNLRKLYETWTFGSRAIDNSDSIRAYELHKVRLVRELRKAALSGANDYNSGGRIEDACTQAIKYGTNAWKIAIDNKFNLKGLPSDVGDIRRVYSAIQEFDLREVLDLLPPSLKASVFKGITPDPTTKQNYQRSPLETKLSGVHHPNQYRDHYPSPDETAQTSFCFP